MVVTKKKIGTMVKQKTMETKRQKIVIGILLSVCMLLWIIEQNLTSQVYILSIQNVNINDKIAWYKEDNREKRNYILYKESYQFIYSQAIKQGFIKATVIYLK